MAVRTCASKLYPATSGAPANCECRHGTGPLGEPPNLSLRTTEGSAAIYLWNEIATSLRSSL